MLSVTKLVLVLVIASAEIVRAFPQGVVLPNAPNFDNDLVERLAVDKFFHLWKEESQRQPVKVTDEQYSIFAPINAAMKEKHLNKSMAEATDLILSHIITGAKIATLNTNGDEEQFITPNDRIIKVAKKNKKFYANGALIIDIKPIGDNGVILAIDNLAFDEFHAEKRYVSDAGIADVGTGDFLEDLLKVLNFSKSSKTFSKFLRSSGIAGSLKKGETYTVLVPNDWGFQRWHPIDWGFYPFSVPEFTEYILRNHFIVGDYKQSKLTDGLEVNTLGGERVIFNVNRSVEDLQKLNKNFLSSYVVHLRPNENGTQWNEIVDLTINHVQALDEIEIPHGRLYFLSDVLFVNDSVVSRLQARHKDKETAPLLYIPWMNAQFLGHTFLMLENDRRFSRVVEMINSTNLNVFVPGYNYTFFVPFDSALNEVDGNLSKNETLTILLDHLVGRRLYLSDLTDGAEILNMNNQTVKVSVENGTVKLNSAKIIESEVFVYNLGTLYYIDQLLFHYPNLNSNEITPAEGDLVKDDVNKKAELNAEKEFENVPVKEHESEAIPEEILTAPSGLPDVLMESKDETSNGTVLDNDQDLP